MSGPKVEIVQLEPMRVACAHGFGTTPENQAHKKMLAFMESKGLLDTDYRHFGFNNPDPSPGSPNYGYDIWVTVGPDVEPEGDITIKDFEGGLFAVARCEALSNIGKVWKQLVAWFEDSGYKRPPGAQWLEELHNPLEPDPEKFVFDLYLPITE